MSRGLLIVNADDFGATPEITDAVAACMAAGAVTSTTAMVYMEDSERAAALARERGLTAVGLHFNLTEPLATAPDEERERAGRLRAHFARLDRRRWTFDPRKLGDIAAAFAAQLAEFHRIYGRAPDHVDSHQHVHTSPDVLLALPRGLKVRQTRSPAPGAPAGPKRRAAHLVKHGMLAGRYRTTDRFWPIDALHPAFRGSQDTLDAAIAVAGQRSVEIMVHPGVASQLPVLLADGWRNLVAAAPAGDYGHVS